MARPVIAALSNIARFIADTVRRLPKSSALLLGIASATGFAPLGLWPATLVAIALLLLLISEADGQRRAFGIGWAFGVGHFTLGLNWIATAFTFQAAMPVWLGWVAVVLLSLYLAIFPALAAWGAWAITRGIFRIRHPRAGGDPSPDGATSNQHQSDSRLRGHDKEGETKLAPLTFAFAATWIVTEWLRSWMFTGFAWNPLVATNLTLAAPAIWVGSYGASALPIMLGGGLLLLAQRRYRSAVLMAVTPALLAGIALLWIDHQSNAAMAKRDSTGDGPKYSTVTVVQPNVGQQDKWQGEKADINFAKLARLTVPLSDQPRLILWPEAAIPDYLETGYPWVYYDRSPAEARARLTALMNPGDVMLLGALKLETDKRGEVVGARNAVMMIRPDATLGPRYDKAHLVPYGEYLPMRPILSAIGLSRLAPGDLDFWPGPGPRTLDLGKFGRAGIQICYEIIFSGQVVDRANRPDFIFNPSNDAWFGSWGPPQHLAQARLRAIEEGLPVIRSTPTGISAVINAEGQVEQSLAMGVAGRIDTQRPLPHAPTLFAQFGNVLPLIFASILLVLGIASWRRQR